jgi:hypothetical protein
MLGHCMDTVNKYTRKYSYSNMLEKYAFVVILKVFYQFNELCVVCV